MSSSVEDAFHKNVPVGSTRLVQLDNRCCQDQLRIAQHLLVDCLDSADQGHWKLMMFLKCFKEFTEGFSFNLQGPRLWSCSDTVPLYLSDIREAL